jgi:predicted DNA-binding protein YlxM (UPF0122 family)
MRKERIKKPYYLEILDIIPQRYIELLVAIEMRKRRFTFQEIGEHFGVSKQAAHQMVRKYEKIIGEKAT